MIQRNSLIRILFSVIILILHLSNKVIEIKRIYQSFYYIFKVESQYFKCKIINSFYFYNSKIVFALYFLLVKRLKFRKKLSIDHGFN